MSDTTMRASLDGSGYHEGSGVIIKANLDIERSAITADTAINRLQRSLGGSASSLSGMSAAGMALAQLQSPVKSLNQHMNMLLERIIRIGATITVFASVGAAVGGITTFVRSGIKAIEEYQVTLIAVTASLTQIALLVQALH